MQIEVLSGKYDDAETTMESGIQKVKVSIIADLAEKKIL